MSREQMEAKKNSTGNTLENADNKVAHSSSAPMTSWLRCEKS